MPPRRRYTFNDRTGRYRDARTGRFVSHRQVRAAVDTVIDGSGKRIKALTEQFRSRALTLGEWETRMRVELKALHLAAARAAKGGRAQMTAADYGRVGQALRTQYRYLRRFADEVQSGKQLPDGSMASRALLYPEAARSVSYQSTLAREMRRRGYDQERNVLDREAAHCQGPGSCPDITKRGWQPIGTLPPLGTRPCMVKDKCHVQYRNSRTGEVAA